ncbi:MAG: hypothetical protein ACE37F_25040 [Nannocystaceae bacterium]|nr:hypothetical protein [bacterium]
MLDPPVAFHAIAAAGDGAIEGVDAMRGTLTRVELAQPEIVDALDITAAEPIVGLAGGTSAAELLALGEVGIRVIDPETESLGTSVPLTVVLDGPHTLTPSPVSDGVTTCDSQGALWSIDPVTGEVGEVVHGFGESCNGLAAPRAPIACVDVLR